MTMLVRYLCAWTACSVTLVFLAGCGPTTPPTKAGPKQRASPQLTVLVVDDPALGDTIKSEWASRTEDEVIIRKITAAEAASAQRLPGDLIIYPAGQLGELVEAGLVAPVSPARTLENDAFALRDVYKLVRQQEMKWGGKVYGLPLGSPQLMLVYRIDIFLKLGVKPPKTWAEYDALAARLAAREELGSFAPAEGAPWRGAVEPLAAGYAGQTLLARSAAYAAHKEQISTLFELTSLKPLITQPPYVKALQEMSDVHGKNKDLPLLSPVQAYQEVARGRCAMAIGWPSSATFSLDKAVTDRADFLGFAELPGAAEVYDFGDKQWGQRGPWEPEHRPEDDPRVPLIAPSGRMVSVTATSGEQEAAENMATWMASSEASIQLSPASSDTTLFRISQEPDAAKWLGSVGEQGKGQYVAALRQTQEHPHAEGIRIPGRREYLSVLDQAVVDAVQGKKTPEEALAAAAIAWDKITDGHGLEKQRVALARSLGLKND